MGRSAGSAEGVDLSPGAPYDMVDLFHQGRGEDETGDDGDEDDAPMFEGPLSALFELFQTPRGFTSGVTNLCDTCGLESPLPVPTAESVHALLFPLPASTLRRLAGKLCLRVPDIRWTAHVRNEQVVHPLVGKLLATLHAYSAFMDRRGNDEERGGGGRGLGLSDEGRPKSSPATPTSSTDSLSVRKDRPHESLRDYAAKQTMVRQLSRLLEESRSMFSGSLAFMADAGRFL